MSKKTKILHIVIIAAMYIVITVITAGISFRNNQVRISEALCILPVFTPAAVHALFIGCFFANLLAGAPWIDVIFGSLATLIGAIGTWKLRNKKPYIAILPPIISNVLIVPFILRYAYGIEEPILKMFLSISLGEICSCFVLGLILYRVLLPHKDKLFGYVKEWKQRPFV